MKLKLATARPAFDFGSVIKHRVAKTDRRNWMLEGGLYRSDLLLFLVKCFYGNICYAWKWSKTFSFLTDVNDSFSNAYRVFSKIFIKKCQEISCIFVFLQRWHSQLLQKLKKNSFPFFSEKLYWILFVCYGIKIWWPPFKQHFSW